MLRGQGHDVDPAKETVNEHPVNRDAAEEGEGGSRKPIHFLSFLRR